MPEIWWSLAGTDKHCDLYAPGHWVHWIQHKLSVRAPGPVIPVTASVDDDGVLVLEGNGFCVAAWNHRPALVHTALRRSGGSAWWEPRWHLLVVPTGTLVDGASNEFSLAAAHEKRGCSVTRTTNPDHLVPRTPAPTNVPPLRMTARYAAGMPKRLRKRK